VGNSGIGHVFDLATLYQDPGVTRLKIGKLDNFKAKRGKTAGVTHLEIGSEYSW
jgi:hypothetical protein